LALSAGSCGDRFVGCNPAPAGSGRAQAAASNSSPNELRVVFMNLVVAAIKTLPLNPMVKVRQKLRICVNPSRLQWPDLL